MDPTHPGLTDHAADLSRLAVAARKRKRDGAFWFITQAEAFLVPGALAPWQWDDAVVRYLLATYMGEQ